MDIRPPLRILSALLCVVLLSCGPKLKEFPSLANTGILPLSTTNAYVGANLFVAKEFTKSTYLFNFLKARGAPTAIELTDEGLSSPRMLMFYPKDKEVYAADLQASEKFYEWVVRGPFRIERKDYKSLVSMDISTVGEPAFVYQGRPWRFRFQREGEVPTAAVVTPVVPTPTPKPKPKKAKSSNTVITKPEDVGSKPSTETWRPLNSDQQALQMAQGFAERSSNGDVIHTVRTEGETLASIAKWYTGSEGAAGTIASASGLGPEDKIVPGSRITIPLNIVKEFKAMK